MDRRYFLKGIGVGALALSPTLTLSSTKSCKVIGIGDAGCNFVLSSSRSSLVFEGSEIRPEFICINFGMDILKEVELSNGNAPARSQIKALSLCDQVSAAGRVNRGRASALQNRVALKAVLANTDVAFLVAGLGGGTGSGVTPIMARLARDVGAQTVAAVVTPFEWEGVRNRVANTAISHLKREADLVVCFSNQELMDVAGDTITQEDFFARQNHRIAVCLGGLLGGENDAPRT